MRPHSWKTSFEILAASVPAFITGWAAAKYTILFPYWDDWSLFPLLESWRLGTFTWMDLWRQHNEHRIIAAKLIHVPLAWLTRWDMRPMIAMNFLTALAGWFFLIRLIHREKDSLGRGGRWMLLLAGGISLFTFRQYENWIWASELVCFLAASSALGSSVLLSENPLTFGRFAAAVSLAVIGSFSFSSGLVIWPAGFIVLVLPGWRSRWKLAGLWSIIAALVLCVWMIGYVKPPHHPPLVFDPLKLMRYVMVYLGSFFSLNPHTGLMFGAAGLLAFAGLTVHFFRSRKNSSSLFAGFSGLCLFALFNGLLTAAGRAGFGEVQATASRYAAFSALFWIGLSGLLLGARPQFRQKIRDVCFLSLFLEGLFLFVLAGAAAASVRSFPGIVELQRGVHQDVAEYLDHPAEAQLYHVYTEPDKIRPNIEKLRSWSFSVFAPDQEARLRASLTGIRPYPKRAYYAPEK